MSEPKGFLIFFGDWPLLEDLTDSEFRRVMQAIASFAGADCSMPENMNRMERTVSRAIIGSVGRALDNYDERCRKNAEAGRKGGLKRAENARRQKERAETESAQNHSENVKQTQACPSAFKQAQANQANDNDNANASANANDNVNAKDNASAKDKSTAAQGAAGAPAASGAADAASHTHAFSPSSQANPSPSAAEAHFEALWALYPVKRGKDKVSSESKQALLTVSEREMQQAIDRYIAEVKASAYDRQWLNGSTWFEGRYRDYIGDDYSPTPRFAGTVQASARSRATTYRAPGEQFDWSSREE